MSAAWWCLTISTREAAPNVRQLTRAPVDRGAKRVIDNGSESLGDDGQDREGDERHPTIAFGRTCTHMREHVRQDRLQALAYRAGRRIVRCPPCQENPDEALRTVVLRFGIPANGASSQLGLRASRHRGSACNLRGPTRPLPA